MHDKKVLIFLKILTVSESNMYQILKFHVKVQNQKAFQTKQFQRF